MPYHPSTKYQLRIVVLLHNIRSLHNVGSIFRTADGAGVEKLFLCGITPAPLDRFGKYRQEMEKVALGAEKTVPWESAKSTASLLKRLKKEGWTIVALEQANNSISYTQVCARVKGKKVALVLGAEVEGLSVSILKLVDYIAEIPMHGTKESLNVSVTAGIILFMLRA